MNYYERYIGDYQRDTGMLTLAQHGAYTMLLDTYFATENPLPADLNLLYRICSAMDSNEKAAVRFVAEKFFPISEDGLRHNEKADEIIIKAARRIAAAVANGGKGGRPRKNKTQEIPDGLWDENPPGIPLGIPTANPEGNPNHNPEKSSPTPTPKKEKHSSETDELPSGFLQFWDAWPKSDRKVAKAECAKRWKARKLEGIASQILADVRSRKETDRSWLTGYEPAPLTYINQKRWEDAESSAPNPFE